ncbi:S9 family peptidase [Kordiimonas marina]|uniref:S9 family peptidase n=1 Tax=Kordiimonas marina TaxID=2872312 RepID=UPI001FF31B51|nr:S9 family peptidase [Kordiimonas marina]MCJ9430649.1 S9 family peptidase [Kordiimonas marina]
MTVSFWKAAAAALVLTTPTWGADHQPFSMADFHKLADLSGPELSPDGSRVVYAASTHNLDSDAPESDLYVVPYKGGKVEKLTDTPFVSEWAPKWAPDGSGIAFLSDSGKAKTTQIWLMSAKGEGAHQVTSVPNGVTDFDWSPDSTHIVFISEPAGPTAGKDSRGEDKPPLPIEIHRFQFKEDYRGFLTNNRQQLFLADVKTGTSVQLTTGDYDNWLPSFAPDGKHIAFVSKRDGDADRNLNFDIFVMEPKPGAPVKQISHFKGTDIDPYWESRPMWSPDSKKLVWLRSGESKWIYYKPWDLVVADVETGKESYPAPRDHFVYKPRFSPDGKSILALIENPENTWLARVDLKSDKVTYLTKGKRFGYDFDVAKDGHIVILDGDDKTPYAVSAVEKTQRPLSNNNDFLKNVALQGTEDFKFMSDGVEIHGMIMKPVGYVPGKRYPTIVRVHGGPVYQFSHEFEYDWQYYAAHGFAIVAINPRGSSGRGFKFASAIYADWGNVDVKDVLRGVDKVVEMGIADPNRLGVGGWSYGSILTDYLIASTTRFKAAVSGAGAGNMFGMYGNDQYSREYELELGTPWKNFKTYVRLSYPFLHADRIKTPTLFQCSEKDFNVPCLGAEQMYQALRSNNIDTRLVIYPGQNHGIIVPSYLEHRLRQTLGWYERFLKH